MSDDEGGASWVFPAISGAEISGKIVGFAYSLDFFGSFCIKAKRTQCVDMQYFKLFFYNKKSRIFLF
ncbi:MAG: hypothetical protein H6574_20310 [Lewinellaceae bacterium]|nr:hypothetical protein [Saprospiraceae bacterium]MCB9333409.1 hypothetical protein [Lewinellaceae bacterium]